MKISSATIESVADTRAMFYLLQAPAEAATKAGAFLQKEKICKRIDAYSFAMGGGRAAYPASQIPFRERREPFRPQRPVVFCSRLLIIYLLLKFALSPLYLPEGE